MIRISFAPNIGEGEDLIVEGVRLDSLFFINDHLRYIKMRKK